MACKIDLMRSLLDELATVECDSENHHKKGSIKVVRELLEDYQLPKKPTKGDYTIKSIKLLANLHDCNITRQLMGLINLSEKALTELQG